VHSIQTNATLVDRAWCEFLGERHVRVGVSIDGSRLTTPPGWTWPGGRRSTGSCAASICWSGRGTRCR
jgi:hypothetical protein